jgi:hypothetical protein
VIPSVHKKGTRVGGLIRYLYGPGKREEHANPHLVAAWDGAGVLGSLEPPAGLGGARDFRGLVELLEQPVKAGRNPPRLTVWHCSVRNHESDRTLSDQQWAHIAREMMAGSGLARHGDDQAVRWVAIRHADDHIHLVATLVRQDRRTEWAHNDRWRCQAAARDLEQRYGLYQVGVADRTSHARPHRSEEHKARRAGRREPARDQLRRQVRFAAAGASSVDEFLDLLRAAGLRVKVRHSSTSPGQVTGYAVALDGHSTGDGQPVWYGGGRLAPDLTVPQLLRQRGWPRSPGAEERTVEQPAGVLEQAVAQVRAAVNDLRRLPPEDPACDAAAYAATDTLTMAARLVEGDRRGELHRAAEALDRAVRPPYRRALSRTRRADELRAVARLLRVAGELADDEALFRMLRLLVDLSLLADALAELRDAQRRLHQARAARAAAGLLRAHLAAVSAGGSPGVAEAEGLTTALPTGRRDARRQGAPVAERAR